MVGGSLVGSAEQVTGHLGVGDWGVTGALAFSSFWLEIHPQILPSHLGSAAHPLQPRCQMLILVWAWISCCLNSQRLVFKLTNKAHLECLEPGPSRVWLSKPSLISPGAQPAGDGDGWGGVVTSPGSAAGHSEAAGLVPICLSVHPSPSPHHAEPSRAEGQLRSGENSLCRSPQKGQTGTSCFSPLLLGLQLQGTA